jgi:WD40 repeat protein
VFLWLEFTLATSVFIVDETAAQIKSNLKINKSIVAFILCSLFFALMGAAASIPSSGTSFNEFQGYAKSIEIPFDVVDLKATFDRYKNSQSGLIPADVVTQLMIKTDVFLTHDWGVDELGRANHDRVAIINKELKALGFVTWFDSDKMTGDVVDKMISGINHTSVVIVFVTQRYMQKVNGSNANDNCRKEFKYAAQTKSSTKMIPVVMEPRMKDINGNWTDLIKMELGNILYVDFSNDNDFQSAIQQLKAEILSRTNPLWVLKSESTFVNTEAVTPVQTVNGSVQGKSEEDLHLIEQFRLWFVSLSITSTVARTYAELLVEKNTGSVTKLQRKLERNSKYLEEIGGFDEDDIIDIKEGLKLHTVVVSGGNDTTSIEVARNSSTTLPQVGKKNESRSHPTVSSVVVKGGKDTTSVEVTRNSSAALPEVVKKRESRSHPTVSSVVVSGGKGTTSVEVTRNSSAALPEVGKKREPRSHPVVSSETHAFDVWSLSWSPVGNKIASGSEDKTIKIWDGISLELVKTLEYHFGPVYSVSWNRDGSNLASGSQDKTIKILDTSTARVITLEGHSSLVLSVTWNHDSSKIVSGSADKTIKLWDIRKSISDSAMTWTLLKTLEGHSDYVYSVSWNHDGSRIISGSSDTTIKIWDSSTGIVLRTLTGHSGYVLAVSWSHDESKIVSGSRDSTVKIWNAITGDLIKTLEGNAGSVNCVAWSPDDRKIASCSYGEKKIFIWDALTGQAGNAIHPVQGAMSVTWSPDGAELVSTENNKIKIFPII